MFLLCSEFIQCVIERRRKLVSGSLTEKKLNALSADLAQLIDLGNHVLNLDLVVRDEWQNVHRQDSLSLVQFFKQYQSSQTRLKAINPDALRLHEVISPDAAKNETQAGRTIFLQVKNMVCKVGEEAELVCFVARLESTRLKQLSDSLLIRWSQLKMNQNIDYLSSLRGLFLEISHNEMESGTQPLMMVIQIVRVGAMELKETEKATRKEKDRGQIQQVTLRYTFYSIV